MKSRPDECLQGKGRDPGQDQRDASRGLGVQVASCADDQKRKKPVYESRRIFGELVRGCDSDGGEKKQRCRDTEVGRIEYVALDGLSLLARLHSYPEHVLRSH